MRGMFLFFALLFSSNIFSYGTVVLGENKDPIAVVVSSDGKKAYVANPRCPRRNDYQCRKESRDENHSNWPCTSSYGAHPKRR